MEIKPQEVTPFRLAGNRTAARPFRNTLLQHFAPDIIERLQLRPVILGKKCNLEVPGQPIKNLFFLEEGIGSMTTIFKSGFQVEVGMFGYESAVGVSALMGTKHSLNGVFMQLAGHGFASPIDAAKAEFERHAKFHFLVLRYVQAQLVQAMQSAACNAHHNHEQRLARWLLICADRAKTDTFDMSQEFLSEMLGNTRPTVSMAAGILKKHGLIDYRRGKISILDPEGLQSYACECYGVVKAHLDNFAAFDTDFAA
jgi:CRP-like cAMP-binding protein